MRQKGTHMKKKLGKEQRAARLTITLAPDMGWGQSPEVRLALIMQALKVNDQIRVTVSKGKKSVRIGQDHKTFVPCLYLQIPRRAFERAHLDGRIARLLTHRVFDSRRGLVVSFDSGKDDWIRPQVDLMALIARAA